MAATKITVISAHRVLVITILLFPTYTQRERASHFARLATPGEI
jgi:hypothetical protein